MIKTSNLVTHQNRRSYASKPDFRSSVQSFASKVIAPWAAKLDKQNSFHLPLWKALGFEGLLGITAPKKYGGLELKFSDHCVAVEEISRVSGSVGLSYAVQSHLIVNQLSRKASDHQKQKYLPKLISGDYIGSIAISEPKSGSDAVSLSTRAIKQPDGSFVLNGEKMWITNGPDAHVFIVYAKTNPDAGSKGMTVFLVDGNSPGITRGPLLDKMGMRGSNTSSIKFENVRVPAENIVGEENKGVYVLMAGLDMERLIMAASPVGLMQGCLDAVLPYVHQREQFGTKIGEFQLMQGKIADMYSKYRLSKAFLYDLAEKADHGIMDRKDCASVVLVCARNACEVGMEAIQAMGGLGYTKDAPVERILRDAKLYEIGAGTNEIRRMLIGREFNDQYLGKKKK